MQSQIKIRNAILNDAESLSKLICDNAERLLKPHYSNRQWEIFKTYYSNNVMKEKIIGQTIFCAEFNDILVGTVGLDQDFVVGFYTHLAYLNLGIGTKLMKHLEIFALEKGIREIQLASSPVGLAFYYKNGWQKVEDKTIEHYGVGFEETLMVKVLQNT